MQMVLILLIDFTRKRCAGFQKKTNFMTDRLPDTVYAYKCQGIGNSFQSEMKKTSTCELRVVRMEN